MFTEFAIADVLPGKLNALVKNIMRQTGQNDPNEAVRLVNSGEWVVSQPTRSWREEDGVIYFSVTSDGTTGEEWIKRQENRGLHLDEFTKQALRSPDFKPTDDGVTTEVAVLPGKLFEFNDRDMENLYCKAVKRKLGIPNAEIACLISEKFTPKDLELMGLIWIVVMHKPINLYYGGPAMLSSVGDFNGSCVLRSYPFSPEDAFARNYGFALAVS